MSEILMHSTSELYGQPFFSEPFPLPKAAQLFLDSAFLDGSPRTRSCHLFAVVHGASLEILLPLFEVVVLSHPLNSVCEASNLRYDMIGQQQYSDDPVAWSDWLNLDLVDQGW
jgi:hypothetical protein